MKIYKRADSVPFEIPVSDYLKNIVPVLWADPAFQASDESRWDEEQKSDFMTSIMLGMAPSKYILCDVKACLQHAIDNESPDDIEYYQNVLDIGYEYLNLDSNNRTINLEDFCNPNGSKIRLSTRLPYDLPQGVFTLTNKNSKYLTLPKPMRDLFDQSTLSLQVYTNVTREQLSQIFEKINDGRPLNFAEKRNAKTSKIAEVIRELAVKYRPYLSNEKSKWFKDSEIIRRGLDDFIAGCAFIYFNGPDVAFNNKDLSNMYDVNSPESASAVKFRTYFDRFLAFCNENLFSVPRKNVLLNLFVIYTELTKNNYVLIEGTTSDAFITHFLETWATLLDDEKTLFNRDKYKKLDNDVNIAGLLGGRQFFNTAILRDMLMERLDIDAYFVELSDKRVVSNTDKFVLGVQQKVTPEGKTIDLSRLQTKDYHKGHKKAHRSGIKSGGVATKANTAIQEADDNIKLKTKEIK